ASLLAADPRRDGLPRARGLDARLHRLRLRHRSPPDLQGVALRVRQSIAFVPARVASALRGLLHPHPGARLAGAGGYRRSTGSTIDECLVCPASPNSHLTPPAGASSSARGRSCAPAGVAPTSSS